MPLSQCSLNRLELLPGSEACWVKERGKLAHVKQMEMQWCVCVCAGLRLAGVKEPWIYQLPSEGQQRCLPYPTHRRCLTISSVAPTHRLSVFIFDTFCLFGTVFFHLSPVSSNFLALRTLYLSFLSPLSFVMSLPPHSCSLHCIIFVTGFPCSQQMLGRTGKRETSLEKGREDETRGLRHLASNVSFMKTHRSYWQTWRAAL